MMRVAVSSTNLASVGYDQTNLVLEIEFRSRSVYQYFNVPPSVHSGLMNAGSKGTYHDRVIRGRYGYRRVGR